LITETGQGNLEQILQRLITIRQTIKSIMDAKIPLVTPGAQQFDELEPQNGPWKVAIKDFDGWRGGSEIKVLVNRLRCHGLYRVLEALNKLRVGVSTQIIYCERICLSFGNDRGNSGDRNNAVEDQIEKITVRTSNCAKFLQEMILNSRHTYEAEFRRFVECEYPPGPDGKDLTDNQKVLYLTTIIEQSVEKQIFGNDQKVMTSVGNLYSFLIHIESRPIKAVWEDIRHLRNCLWKGDFDKI
jgi:hypothetical protein